MAPDPAPAPAPAAPHPRPRRTLPLLALLVAAAAPFGIVGAAPEVLCQDDAPRPAGCPDLLPDARALSSWGVERLSFPRPGFGEPDCAIEEGLAAPGERVLLRFATVAQNAGPADLAIGDPRARPEWYTWSPCHGHWHFDDFAHYRLWTPEGHARWSALRAAEPARPASALLDEHPELRDHLRAGHKQGFCIIDSHPIHPLAGYPAFSLCAHQGISAGWQDVYGPQLDGQWIDVTGLPAGGYVLEVELNPERRIEEADYADNAAATLVAIDPAA